MPPTRGAELTQHLLAFARKQPLQPRETDVNTLVVETAKLLRPTLGEQIEIEIGAGGRTPGRHWSIPTSSRPRSSISSLNARDAMPDGGKLMLETSNVLPRRGLRRHAQRRHGPATTS